MNSNSKITMTRGDKILLFLYEYGKGEKTRVRYEDIVAGIFKKYPADFHLKGYPEYPDSGDLIHKPLYDFKKKGLVNAENKIFSLTDRGLEQAAQLVGRKSEGGGKTEGRLSRSTETEFSRVKSSEGFEIFVSGRTDKLSDNDFYTYLGVTVRTPKNAFLGRLETMIAASDELKKHESEAMYKKFVAYHEFLVSKHDDIVNYFKNG